MKTSILTVLVALAIAGFTVASHAHASPAPRTLQVTPVSLPEASPPATVDATIYTHEVTITARVPSKRVTARNPLDRKMTCGEVYTNAIGGRNSDCHF